MQRRGLILLLVPLVVGCIIIIRTQTTSAPHLAIYRQATFNDREVEFLIVPLPHTWRWELVNDPAHPKSVQSWRKELGAEIVFNAAYFTEDYSPAGFLKTNTASTITWPTTEQQTDRKSYTFLLDVEEHDLRLHYLPAAPQAEPPSNAFLSFPTLLVDGQANVTEDSLMYAARTMVAEDNDGNDFLIQTTYGTVSLYEVAYWLASQPEQFVIAGNLDGGPSTGVSLENGNDDVESNSALVPSVIAGYKQNER